MANNLFVKALLSMRKIDERTAAEAERLIEVARADGSSDTTEALLVKHGVVSKRDATKAREAIGDVKKNFGLAQTATDALKRSSERLAEMARAISEDSRRPALAHVRRRRGAR